MRRLVLLFALISLSIYLTLTACTGETSIVPAPPTEGPSARPTATSSFATAVSSVKATESPTAVLQPTLELAPTPVPSDYPVKAYPPIEQGCQYQYFFLPSPDTCPKDFPRASAAAEQPFEGGTMIWLGSEDLIVILFEDQSWRSIEDTWEERQQESDPSIEAPTDRYQPIRGFGKVWREEDGLRRQLGWALSPELGFDTVLQEQQTSEGVPDTNFVRLFNEKVVALTQREHNSGDWVIASSP